MRINESFNIKPKITEDTGNKESLFYCLVGNEEYIDDNGNPRVSLENDKRVMAKAIPNKPSKHMTNGSGMQYRFYIMSKPNDIIHNPVQLATTVKDKEAFNFINNTCKNSIQFKEVTQSVFDKYITFLKTKNIRWLNAAQRELK
jgi:hypothetical protein